MKTADTRSLLLASTFAAGSASAQTFPFNEAA